MDHLQLGLTLSMSPCFSSESISSDNCGPMKKRRFDHDQVEMTTLPLFKISWRNEEEEEDDESHKDSSITNNDDEDESIVGWPPVNTWRKKHLEGGLIRNNNNIRVRNNIGDFLVGKSKSTHMKVTMEGMAIGRKIDLSLHHSYHTLAHTLFDMFGKDEETMKNYEVTYQDIDGDWLLIGDVPWSSFVETAQRLKLVRSRA